MGEARLSSDCLEDFVATQHMTSLCTEMLLSKLLLARYQRLNTCGYHLLAQTSLYKQRSRSISNHRLLFWWLWPNVERSHQSRKPPKVFNNNAFIWFTVVNQSKLHSTLGPHGHSQKHEHGSDVLEAVRVPRRPEHCRGRSHCDPQAPGDPVEKRNTSGGSADWWQKRQGQQSCQRFAGDPHASEVGSPSRCYAELE